MDTLEGSARGATSSTLQISAATLRKDLRSADAPWRAGEISGRGTNFESACSGISLEVSPVRAAGFEYPCSQDYVIAKGWQGNGDAGIARSTDGTRQEHD